MLRVVFSELDRVTLWLYSFQRIYQSLNISTISSILLAGAVKHLKYRIVDDSLWEMNHNVSLGIVAIVAAMMLTAVAFAVPQQASAYRHHHNHNHNNSIKVDQQVNQENNCTGVQLDEIKTLDGTGSSTVCLNQGDNSADIVRWLTEIYSPFFRGTPLNRNLTGSESVHFPFISKTSLT